MSTPWHPLTRIAFRFCVVYFGLFCLLFAQIVFVYAGILTRWSPPDAVIWQLTRIEPVLAWVGRRVFGIDAVLHRDSHSGDQAVIWMLVFTAAVVAVAATLIWSILDRHRRNYTRLHAWFCLFVRLCLAGQLLFYGIAKVIPTQMPAPPLAALLQPFGELTPASVLWLQVGTSLPYEIALGSVELVAGLLLFWNRTATLGALLAAMSMAQVFLLNLSYDVPVKILSSHLLVLSLFLLAPQARRLADLLVLQRPAPPATQPALFTDVKRNRIAAAVVALLGVWVLVGCLAEGASAWRDYGGGREKPELHGIWEVTRFTADGAERPPLTTDALRWQRVIFDVPGVLTYQQMDGTLRDEAIADEPDGTMRSAALRLHPVRQTPDRLELTGRIADHPVTLTLQRVDLRLFPLHNTRFRWVQDYPRFA
ncbi:MAG: DoxX family protein [Actinomycetota bacterium]